MIKATFENILRQITELIADSKDIIYISVSMFTSRDLLGQLEEKLRNDCSVEIIISDHVENNRLSFDRFIKLGGKVYVISRRNGKFLHDKFAVFDNKKVISGTYNWTNAAEYYNHESMVISDDKVLLKQFDIHFKKLKEIVLDYDRKVLVDKRMLNAESKDGEFEKLEKELEEKFIYTIEESNRLGANVDSDYVMKYLDQYGAIGGAARLIIAGTEKLQADLTKLAAIGRLDISFENIILQKKFRILFDKTVLEHAERKLIELNS